MIPEKANLYSSFIKLPNPLKNQEGDIKIGESVNINDEFKAPESPKIKSALVGLVSLDNGTQRTVGLNWNSYYAIAKDYGKDTADWIGKDIVYKGLTQFEKGTGHLWIAKS